MWSTGLAVPCIEHPGRGPWQTQQKVVFGSRSVVVSQETAAEASSERERSEADRAAWANRSSVSTRICQAADALGQPLGDISHQEVRPTGDTEPPITAAEPDPIIGTAWIAPEPTSNNRPVQEKAAPSRLRHTCAAFSRAFRNAASARLGVIGSATAQTASAAATAAAAAAAPADPAQASAAVAAHADPAPVPADCQAAAAERVLSHSEIPQGLVDSVAAVHAQRANLEGALVRPGALQQRYIAAPRIFARALAVQLTDAMLQTNQEVQASPRAARSAQRMPEQLSAAKSARGCRARSAADQQRLATERCEQGATQQRAPAQPRPGGRRQRRTQEQQAQLAAAAIRVRSARVQCTRVTVSTVLALVLVGIWATATWVAAGGAARRRGRHRSHICPL